DQERLLPSCRADDGPVLDGAVPRGGARLRTDGAGDGRRRRILALGAGDLGDPGRAGGSAVDPADGAAPGELLEPGRRRRPGRGRLTRRDRGTALPIDPHRPHRLGGPGFMGLQSMSYYAALTW